VNSAMRASVCSGNGRCCGASAVIAPHSLPATTIGVPAAEYEPCGNSE